MHFTSGINRPPYEANSGFLQVTSGCSHASCAFCGYFKDTPFRRSPMEEIEADVKEIGKYFGKPKRIFLQGADGFAASYDTLMRTADLIHQYVPSGETIGGYARIDNFRDKTVEQLRNMKAAGFADPYLGVESGDDVILERVHKGYDARTAREQMEKLDAAGMPFIANFLNGLGGRGYGLGHARKTAAIYDGLHISMIEVSSLTLVPRTILYRKARSGEFEEATEVERLQEMQEFVKGLTNETVFLADHISVPFFAKSRLPEGKAELAQVMQKLIDGVGERQLRRFRETHPIM